MSRQRTTITEDDLYKAETITPRMAADYLGPGVSEHGARVLARAGRIGEPIPGTNRTYIQARKLIAFKHGVDDHEEWCRTLARVLKEEGLNDIAVDFSLAMLRVAEKYSNRQQGATRELVSALAELPAVELKTGETTKGFTSLT